MGCKWRRACEDNKIQNFQGPNDEENPKRSYNNFQCHNGAWWKTGSVCRQCCDGHAMCGYEFVQQNHDFDERYADSLITEDGNGPRDSYTWKLNLYNTDNVDFLNRPIGKDVNEEYNP